VKDVEIPSGMQRAMARQAEAERERRAKVIAAEGEFQASSKLADAAAVIAEHPIALQLRYLQTLLEISGTNNTSTVLPVPLDLLRAIQPGGSAELASTCAAAPSRGCRSSSRRAGRPGRARSDARPGSPTRPGARSARGTRR
jgi:hypothetical protein